MFPRLHQPTEPLNGACRTCSLPHGFHDAQIHGAIYIDPRFFKEKDWQKNAKRPAAEDVSEARDRADGNVGTTSRGLASFLSGLWSA